MEFFDIEEYDYYNLSHRSAMLQLNNDVNVRKYFNDFDRYINNIIEHGKDNNINRVFIVSKNSEIVGMIMIDYYEPRYYISYALLPNKRHEHLGSLLLGDFVEYLFRLDININDVYLEINASNIASIKTALSVGFERIGKTSYQMNNYLR